MQTERIYSRNAAYQKLQVLKTNRNKRFKYQSFFVEGVRNINKAVENGWRIRSFLYTKDRNLSDWARHMLSSVQTEVNYELSAPLMNEISEKTETSELIAIIGMKNDSLDTVCLSSNPMIALFDRASNKGNLGTIIRSCDALGVECLLLTGHAVDLYDPEVIVASMGTFFNLQVIRVPENEKVLQFIQKMKTIYPGFLTIGTTAHHATPLHQIDLTHPVLFMIGNETEGLCRVFKESCDILGTIPMAASSYASSFNVGCAATVMFYEAVRQRQTGTA